MASIFTDQVPVSLDEPDSVTGSLGTNWYSELPGTVDTVLYYKGNGAWNGQAITAGLYDAAGELLTQGSRVQLVGDATGWVAIPLDTTVSIAANVTYTAAYKYAGTSHYVASAGFFVTAVDSFPLHAYADDPAGVRNGVFVQPSPALARPTATFSRTCYFVDVNFTGTDDGMPPDLTHDGVTVGAQRIATATDVQRLSITAGSPRIITTVSEQPL